MACTNESHPAPSPAPWPRRFVVAIAMGAAVLGPWTDAAAQGSQPAVHPTALPVPAPVRGLPDFTGLVEAVGPAVVNIRVSQKARPAAADAPQVDPDVEQFLRRFGIPVPHGGTPGQEGDDDAVQRGIGSGFILSPDGYVMTNAHVVDGADEVRVTLTDKREFKARIVGVDARTDVAVVKIDAKDLPCVRIGDVNHLKVGEWVIAIGSPFGLSNTVTAGIVSAKQRDTGDYLRLLQTDVAINPGNSGGPLINMRGEVVGVNSEILTMSGNYAGISLAIPIDEAIRIADQLRTTGHVVRGRIGVQIAQVSDEIAQSLGLDRAAGAVVESVQPGLPADRAGVQAGDIITQVDGVAVEQSSDLPRLVGDIRPGATAHLRIYRNRAFHDIALKVVEFKDDVAAAAPDAARTAALKGQLGLKVNDLGEAQRADLHLRGGVQVEVAEGPAARVGIRQGDLILSVNGVDIASAAQFTRALAQAEPGKPVNLLVRRGDVAHYVLVRPASK